MAPQKAPIAFSKERKKKKKKANVSLDEGCNGLNDWANSVMLSSNI